MKISTGILTISDKCSQGLREDKSGQVLKTITGEQNWNVSAYSIVPDEEIEIEGILKDWCNNKKISLILTTGGTGIGPRDVTPEVTLKLLDKELPGISEFIRHEGTKHTPFSALSRGVAGIRGETFIINLPGSPKGAGQSLNAIIQIIPHALAMIKGMGH